MGPNKLGNFPNFCWTLNYLCLVFLFLRQSSRLTVQKGSLTSTDLNIQKKLKNKNKTRQGKPN